MNTIYLQRKLTSNQDALCVIAIILSLSLGLIFGTTHQLVYAINYNGNNNNNTANKTSLDNGTNLQITTNKQTYKLGEKLIVTIKNNLKFPLKFSDSLLGLTIKNVKSGQSAGLFAAQVISELKPNESKSIQWDQRDANAKQVEPGVYEAKCSSMTEDLHHARPFIAGTTFSIT